MSEKPIHDLTGQEREFDGVPVGHAEAQRALSLLLANFPEGLHGYLVFGVSKDGHWSCGWRVNEGEVIGPTLFGALVKEAVNSEVSVDRRIRDLVQEG